MNIAFPSIAQFRNVIRELRKVTQHPVEFVGYTKLHGTNASILFTDESTFAQSKNRTLSIGDDNAGFAGFVAENAEAIEVIKNELLAKHPQLRLPFEICGEWAGAGIQKNVAITGLPKFFAIFGIANVVDSEKLDFIKFDEEIKDNSVGIYNISQFGKWTAVIDPENPAEVQNYLVETSLQVEKECPAGRFFGVSGIGEGIVWSPVHNPDRHLWFKVKGEKHSVSKVKTLVSVDPEKMKGISEFVDYAVTENRMNQGIQETGEVQNSNIPQFLKWMNADILKEESDVLKASNLEFKDVVKACNAKSLAFYKSKMI